MRNLLFTGLLLGVSALSAQQDPPSRVARLSFLQGSVSFQAAGQEDWSAAALNYPLTVGDHLWADEQSRAELDLGSAAVRLDDHTALAFLNLDDRVAQMRLSDGSVNITIRQLDPDESYEIDTPNCAISLLRPGVYRIDSDPDRQVASVAVLSGEAEVTANGTAFPVHARQAGYVTGDQQTSTEVAAPQPPDDFDHWAASRDDRFSRQPPPRYVSPQMVGSEDLDQYGVWTEDPGLGPALESLERIARFALAGADRDAEAFTAFIKEHSPGAIAQLIREGDKITHLIEVLSTVIDKVASHIATIMSGDIVAARALMQAARTIQLTNLAEARESATK